MTEPNNSPSDVTSQRLPQARESRNGGGVLLKGMAWYTCEFCNVDFQARVSDKKGNHVFCSLLCANRGKKWRGKITACCEQCAKSFERQRAHYNREKHHFCGQPCFAKWRSNNLRGKNAYTWKGGRYINPAGYVLVQVSALSQTDQELVRSMQVQGHGKRTARVSEHRLVMAKTLGRPLKSNEAVHHLNGIKDDNRPENLATCGRLEHNRSYAEIVLENLKLKREIAQLKEDSILC